MDPLTQATLGAAAAQVSRPKRFVAGSCAGGLGGFLPDADILIRSSSDPLLFLEYHRHFTHSLPFVPIGGALVAFCCAKVSRGRVGFKEMYLPATLGWATHGLLDSCTSYGTYLYWPFSNERVAWHLISIVDPLFTLPLLAGVIWAARKRSARVARAFLATALAYIGLCAVQLHRAESIHAGVIADRAHVAERVEVKPSIGNNFLYRAFYEYDGAYYVDAVRVPWLGTPKVYPGSHHPALDIDDYVAQHNLGELHENDLGRFDYFSAGYLVEDPRHEGVVSDFRYAMVPNGIAPLWGVDVLGTPAGDHLAWLQFRDMDRSDQEAFMTMVRGR